MTLGQRIRQIRIGHGLPQEAFAARPVTIRPTASRRELDQTYPDLFIAELKNRENTVKHFVADDR